MCQWYIARIDYGRKRQPEPMERLYQLAITYSNRHLHRYYQVTR
jgi:hypothetical protein